jgi:hypothetical protein
MTADTTPALDGRALRDSLAVDLPETELDGLKIERFEIRNDVETQIFNLRADGRGVRPGTYTKLTRDGRLWMSDTHAERRDHFEPLLKIARSRARRVLINGLGIGMIVQAALALDHVEHIDVVEIDPRVAALVGPHYTKSGRVTIHVADAYEQTRRWPTGTRWDVGWSDIWPDMCADNLPGMAKLNRSYGRRCAWHACWGQQAIKFHERRYGW